MKHLLTLRDEDLFANVKNLPHEGWFKRNAARAVVFSDTGEVYLLKMAARNYHKLPGGGVNMGELRENALYRELLEEIGCPAGITDEIGEIIEYRNLEQMEQHSYCYIAQQNAPLGETALEDDEIDDGAETIKVKNIDEAILLLESDEPTNYEGHFIQQRDLCFLRAAKRAVSW